MSKVMKNKAAQELGRLGGAVTSKVKAAASRENGKLGGRKSYVHYALACDTDGMFYEAACGKCFKKWDGKKLASYAKDVTCPKCRMIKE